MKLWQFFGAAAVVVGMAPDTDAQTVCRANVCSNSGSMPNGTYTNRNGQITTPGNLPRDAYVRDPRTGRHIPYDQYQRRGSSPEIEESPYVGQHRLPRMLPPVLPKVMPRGFERQIQPHVWESNIPRHDWRGATVPSPSDYLVGERSPYILPPEEANILTLAPTFTLKAQGIEAICNASLLDTSTVRDVAQECAAKSDLKPNVRVGQTVPHPFNRVIELDNGSTAFCRAAALKGKPLSKVTFHSGGTVKVGKQADCIIYTPSQG